MKILKIILILLIFYFPALSIAIDGNSGLVFSIRHTGFPGQVILVGSTHYGFNELNESNLKISILLKSSCEAFADESTVETIPNGTLSKYLELTGIPLAKDVLNESQIQSIYQILLTKYNSNLAIFGAGSTEDLKFLQISTVIALLPTAINTTDAPISIGTSLDKHFSDIAKSRNLPMHALEKRKDIYEHYKNIHPLHYKKFIDGLLSLHSDSIKQRIMAHHFKLILQNIEAGDVNGVREEFIKSFSNSMKLDSDIVSNIYFGRDSSIATQIGLLVDNGVNYCVALGAAHLGGSEGVLEKLRIKNYKIEQIKF